MLNIAAAPLSSDLATTSKSSRGWDRLLPVIRAGLAQRLKREGFKVGEIASLLEITPAAVVQYLKGSRGSSGEFESKTRPIIDALADKLLRRIRADGKRGLETIELIDAADHIRAAIVGESILQERPDSTASEKKETLGILRQRLQLELRASETCLQLATKVDDEYTKLLLRMIASDSMRHADVISQVISWVELSRGPHLVVPKRELLDAVLQIEDKAQEFSLRDSIDISHPVARLLLEWIDADEKKHERAIGKLLRVLRKDVS